MPGPSERSTAVGPRRPGKRPGPKPRLSRDAILDMATRTDPLSVGAVAAGLGVAVGSLYRHVDGLDDLAAGAVAHLLGAAPLPGAEQGWRVFLEHEAATQVRLRREHAALFAVPAADLAASAVQRLDRVVRTLVDAGFGVDDAVLVTDSVADLVRDGVRQALAVQDVDRPAPGLSPRVDEALRRVLADPWAHLDRKLAMLLDGAAVRRG